MTEVARNVRLILIALPQINKVRRKVLIVLQPNIYEDEQDKKTKKERKVKPARFYRTFKSCHAQSRKSRIFRIVFFLFMNIIGKLSDINYLDFDITFVKKIFQLTLFDFKNKFSTLSIKLFYIYKNKLPAEELQFYSARI